MTLTENYIVKENVGKDSSRYIITLLIFLIRKGSLIIPLFFEAVTFDV